MATQSTPVTETSQITVRLPTEMVKRIDRLCKTQGNQERSAFVREALADYLSAEAPELGSFPRAVKGPWMAAIRRAFADEGVLWTPISSASFWDIDPAVAASLGAVCVHVKRPGFALIGNARMFTGTVEFKRNVNSLDELYHETREAVREAVAGKGQSS